MAFETTLQLAVNEIDRPATARTERAPPEHTDRSDAEENRTPIRHSGFSVSADAPIGARWDGTTGGRSAPMLWARVDRIVRASGFR
jgi:hypothetical protein